MTAYSRRQYSGVAPDTTITAGINSAVLALTLASGTGYPDGSQGNFFLVLDPGLSLEEVVLCSATAGTAVTIVSRGQCGTAAVSHGSGAAVRHPFTSQDADEANKAVAETVGRITTKGDLLLGTGANALIRQGIGSNGAALVADNSQASGVGWSAPIPAPHDHSTSGLGGAIPEASVTNLVSDLSNKANATDLTAHTAAAFGVHGVAGFVVGSNDVQPLTNKDLSSPTNTFPAALATLTGAQTFTNKEADGLTVRPVSAATVGLVVKAQSAQASNLVTFQDSAGTTVGGIDNSGRLIPHIPGQDVQITANVTAITTGTDLATLAAITGDGVTKVKITCGFDSIQGSVDGDILHVSIMEGATQIANRSYRKLWITNNTGNEGVELSIVITPSAASHTYKATASRAVGTGTAQINASATSPGFIRIEQFQ